MAHGPGSLAVNRPAFETILCCFLLLVTSTATAAEGVAADLLLLDGKVWTVAKDRPDAEAVAVGRDRILAVGPSAELRPLAGPRTRVIDLRGRRVLPGFYDSHVHLLDAGQQFREPALKDARDEAEFGRILRQFDRKLPRGRWLL